MSFSRGDLFTRLLVLVAAASAPAIAVHVYLQSDVNAAADRMVMMDARHTAELLHADLGAVVEGARQISLMLGQDASVQQFNKSCSEPLGAIVRAMPRYEMLRIVDEDGTVICSTSPQSLTTLDRSQRQRNELTLARGSFEAGTVTPREAGVGAMLTFSQAFVGRGQRRGVIDIGLSNRWLEEHFSAFSLRNGAHGVIADRNGLIAAEIPSAGHTGTYLASDLLALLDAPQIGATLLSGANNASRPYGYVPRSVPPGLFVGAELALPSAAGFFTERENQSFLLMGLGTLLSLGLAMVVGQIFVRRPTNALLDAAGRWSMGELDTRVIVSGGRHSEFGKLAVAFNAMAAALSRQRIEATELLDTMEARVTARTDDLLKSRDKLQVAMAQQAKSEASLNQMQKLQAVGQLAGGIAYDFNNLLTAVISALEMLRMRLPAEDTRSHRLLDNALHAADRGGRLTSKLLSFSRRQLLVPVPIDLNAVLLGMVSLLTTTLGSKIRIETGLAPALWPALADPNQVESAILNLALNARDAMPDGGTLRISTINVSIPVATVRTEDRAGLSRASAGSPGTSPQAGLPGSESAGIVVAQPPLSGDFVMIRVSDTGSGMPPEVLARVFEPFFTTKKQGRGTGLGLSQVHGLAAQSGGEVRLSSEPGLGTTVSLLLPRADTLAVAETGQPGEVAHRAHAGGMLVLLVDDDADVLSLTAEMLAELGHRPLIATGGDVALRMLEEEVGIDVLLTDYAMPGMDGLELIEMVTRGWPDTRTVLMTGHAEIDLSKYARIHPVLSKPFTMAGLSQVLESIRASQGGAAPHRDAAE